LAVCASWDAWRNECRSTPIHTALPLVAGDEKPVLLLAQRAIALPPEVDVTPEKPDDSTVYKYVEVEGWRPPALAGLMSAAVPGTGQLYSGSKSGYIFLGVEAVALASYLHFSNKEDDARDDAQQYAGDPYSTSSRWSFDELSAAGVTNEEVERLQRIYASDRIEFYNRIASESRYLAGWRGIGQEETAEREGYLSLDDDREGAARAARASLFAVITNHVVSTVHAIREARLNNFRLTEDLSLKVDGRTGSKSKVGATLTLKF
jgi:hypothetical protein